MRDIPFTFPWIRPGFYSSRAQSTFYALCFWYCIFNQRTRHTSGFRMTMQDSTSYWHVRSSHPPIVWALRFFFLWGVSGWSVNPIGCLHLVPKLMREALLPLCIHHHGMVLKHKWNFNILIFVVTSEDVGKQLCSSSFPLYSKVLPYCIVIPPVILFMVPTSLGPRRIFIWYKRKVGSSYVMCRSIWKALLTQGVLPKYIVTNPGFRDD
jgi:hypothetical protein